MKSKRRQAPILLDQQALSKLHTSILEKVQELDSLNQEFKLKQEHHFLKTYISVLQRMGNQLILAQQAYRNIDIEIKRQKYYQEIADELTFFKDQCFLLKRENKKLKEQVHNVKLDFQTAQGEIQFIKESYQKKCQETNLLREKMGILRKSYKEGKKEKSRGHQTERGHLMEFSNNQGEDVGEKRQQVAQRWVQTQQMRRRGNRSSDTFEELNPNQKQSGRYVPSKSKYTSTNHTSFRRRSNQKQKKPLQDSLFD